MLHRSPRKKSRGALVLALLVASLIPLPASAVNRDVKAVLVTGTYGLLAGTAVGLISYPFSRQARNIAIGSSVGLYLGIAVGIYHVLHRDDPENPLRSQVMPHEEFAQLLTSSSRPETQGANAPMEGGSLRVDFPVFRF